MCRPAARLTALSYSASAARATRPAAAMAADFDDPGQPEPAVTPQFFWALNTKMLIQRCSRINFIGKCVRRSNVALTTITSFRP